MRIHVDPPTPQSSLFILSQRINRGEDVQLPRGSVRARHRLVHAALHGDAHRRRAWERAVSGMLVGWFDWASACGRVSSVEMVGGTLYARSH